MYEYEETAQPRAQPMPQHSDDGQYIEDDYGVINKIISPGTKGRDYYNPDLVTSNINENEFYICRGYLHNSDVLDSIGYKKAADHMLHCAMRYLSLSKSKNGFAANIAISRKTFQVGKYSQQMQDFSNQNQNKGFLAGIMGR